MAPTLLDRRGWFPRTGALAALGALSVPRLAQAQEDNRDNQAHGRVHVVIDVAGTGVWVHLPGPPYAFPPLQATLPADLGGTDSPGASGLAEGLIFPGGTITAETGFDPSSTPAIGHWSGSVPALAGGADRPHPSGIYDWFTEGFETADLRQAATMLGRHGAAG